MAKAPAKEAPVKDYSDILPAGYEVDAKDLRLTGSLTPIYMFKEAFENKFPRFIAELDRIEFLPEQKKGRDPWIPTMLRFVLLSPTKAIVGSGEEKKIVDLKVGDDILVPVNGNVRMNREIERDACDRSTVHVYIVEVTGQMDTGQINEMWVCEMRKHPKNKERTGRFAVPFTFHAFPQKDEQGKWFIPGGGETSNGSLYDKDGVVVLPSEAGAAAS